MAGSTPVPPLYRGRRRRDDIVAAGPRGGSHWSGGRRGAVGDQSPCLAADGAGDRDGVWTRARSGAEVFADRDEAGRRLGERVRELGLTDPVVLGLPRGGVPVAVRVAEALDAPMDVLVVRKVGVARHPELAMGAVGEEGARVVHEPVVRAARVSPQEYAAAEQVAVREVARRAEVLREGRPPLSVAGRTVVVVDDGVATGSTARAACQAARARGAARVVLAAPVGPAGCAEELRDAADDVVLLETPPRFRSVGDWYDDFRQLSDEEVVRQLAPPAAAAPAAGPTRRRAARRPAGRSPAPLPPGRQRRRRRAAAHRPADPARRPGTASWSSSTAAAAARAAPATATSRRCWTGPGSAACCSTCSRPRRSATGPTSSTSRCWRSGCGWPPPWLRSEASGVDPDTPLGYFGASTGAAAALLAAADADADVAAVVSRGGRPDLAGPRLPYVHCPTLLIVGGDDEPVLTLNRRARSRLTCPSRLVVVPGATHLFEERGALERVAGLARDWFLTHLTRPDPPAPTATEHAPFSWRAAAPAITGLPHGRGLNIAHEAVDRHLQLGRGGHVAVRSIGADGRVTDLTYAALAERTSRFAGVLDRLGVGPGEHVFSLMGRGPDLFVAALGTLKHASVFCPLFSAFGPEPVRERLRLGDARVLVTTPTLYRRRIAGVRDALPALQHVLLVGEDAADLAAQTPGTLDLASAMAAAEPVFEIPPTDPEDGGAAALHQRHHRQAQGGGARARGRARPPRHRGVRPGPAPGRRVLVHRRPGLGDRHVVRLIAPLTHGVTVVTDAGEFDARRWYRVLAGPAGDGLVHRADRAADADAGPRRPVRGVRPVGPAARGQRRRGAQPRGGRLGPAGARPDRSTTTGGRPRPARS